jgi:hypothetical protein
MMVIDERDFVPSNSVSTSRHLTSVEQEGARPSGFMIEVPVPGDVTRAERARD